MKKYPKIDSLYKRDKNKKLIIGEYTCPEFEYLQDCIWEFTEKVDGTNIRVGRYYDGWDIRGRTDNAQIPPHLMDKLKSIFHGKIEIWRDIFQFQDVVIYGEGYGPKINGGGKYRSTPDFVVFDIRIGDWWMRRPDVENICQTLGLDVVPLLGAGSLDYWIEHVGRGFDSDWGHFQAEGVVATPEIPLLKRNGDRVITKLCCRDYQS